MSKTVSRASARKNELLSMPGTEHFVQFYTYEHVLLDMLEKYVHTGLRQGQTCIVIATGRHRQELEKRLKDLGTDIPAARMDGQYLAFDAVDTLSGFLADNSINRDLFFEQVGDIVSKAAKSGRPVRAFGEMVALLWKKHNTGGVIQLEKLWNELADQYSFSLYCAYPMMYFVREIHQEVMDEISKCHTLVTPDIT